MESDEHNLDSPFNARQRHVLKAIGDFQKHGPTHLGRPGTHKKPAQDAAGLFDLQKEGVNDAKRK